MRPEVLGYIRQQAWRLIAGRLDHLAVETCKCWLHTRLPGVVIPCLRCLLQQDIVAYWLYAYQAQTARKRFILRQRNVSGWHLVGQPLALLLTVRHDGFFNTPV